MNAPARATMALLALSCAAAPLAAQRVAEVQVVPQLLRLRVGATYRAQATAYDENGVPFEPRFYWTSSNINVATVDPAGSVLGVSSGLAVITASPDSGRSRRGGRITVMVQGAGTDGKRLLALDTVLAPECEEPEISVRNAGRRCWDTRPELRGPPLIEVPAACAAPAVTPEVFYARITPAGEIAETRPLSGSNCAAYTQAAMNRVRELGFHPAHRGGRPVAAWTLVVIRPPYRMPTMVFPPTPPLPPTPGAAPGGEVLVPGPPGTVVIPAAHRSAAFAVLRDARRNEVGRVVAYDLGDSVRLVVQALVRSPAGVHVHAIGRCEPPDFASAGPHLNPLGRHHGLENPAGPHAGDLPNLRPLGGAQARLTYTVPLSLAQLLDVDGSAVILHGDADDQHSDPGGNSGSRAACGVLVPR